MTIKESEIIMISPRQIARQNGDIRYITNCKTCGKETEHYVNNSSCIVCEKGFKRSQRGLMSQKYGDIKRRYGITKDEWHWLLKEQYGKCKICNKEMEIELGVRKNSNSACVDHDHETGGVRGLLCSNCNMGLGYFKDDVVALQSAIIYLNETTRINVN